MINPSVRITLFAAACIPFLCALAACGGDEVEATNIVNEGPPPTPETLSPQGEEAAGVSEDEAVEPDEATAAAKIALTSTAFQEGGNIPQKYTGDGQNVSPPLQWTDPPQGAKSFALIADDPDAPRGTWVHWVVYDLPPSTRDLPEAVPPTEALASGGKQGTNDFHKLGYGGPAPPPGKPHRYYFKLYALDTELNLPPGRTKKQVEEVMQGHVVAEAQLMGKYGR